MASLVVARHAELRAVRDLHRAHERAPGRLAREAPQDPAVLFHDDDQAFLDRDRSPATAPSRAPASDTSPRPEPREETRRRPRTARGRSSCRLRPRSSIASKRSRRSRPRSRRRAPGRRPSPRRRSGPPACFRRRAGIGAQRWRGAPEICTDRCAGRRSATREGRMAMPPHRWRQRLPLRYSVSVPPLRGRGRRRHDELG